MISMVYSSVVDFDVGDKAAVDCINHSSSRFQAQVAELAERSDSNRLHLLAVRFVSLTGFLLPALAIFCGGTQALGLFSRCCSLALGSLDSLRLLTFCQFEGALRFTGCAGSSLSGVLLSLEFCLAFTLDSSLGITLGFRSKLLGLLLRLGGGFSGDPRFAIRTLTRFGLCFQSGQLLNLGFPL
jgi:hypothetical protein